MHYYQWNIGNYYRDTAGLSHMEDLAYRRMIDRYYLTEQPLNGCSSDVAKRCGMVEFEAEVAFVLDEYFDFEDGFWHHSGIDDDIKEYRRQKKQQSKAGKASGKARRAKAAEQASNDRSTTVEPTSNQEPVTTKNTRRFAPPTKDDIDLYCIDKDQLTPSGVIDDFIDFYESKGWMVGKNKMKDWKAAWRRWIKNNKPPAKTSSRSRTLKEDLTDRSWAAKT